MDDVKNGTILRSWISKAVNKRKIFMAHLEVTGKCNASCEFCCRSSISVGSDLTFQECENIATALRELGCLYLSLTGGEPLLRSDLEEIAWMCVNKGFAVSISTNAHILTPERFNDFSSIPFESILVSVHAIEPSLYSEIYGIDVNMEFVLDQIIRLKQRGHSVKINCVLTDMNIAHASKVKSFFVERGFSKWDVGFDPVYPSISNAETAKSLLTRFDGLTDCYVSFSEEIEKATQFEKQRVGCIAGRAMVSIDSRGNVHPCTLMDFSLGNCLKEPLADIWRSRTIDMFRMIPEEAFGQCRTCEAKPICDTCMAHNYNQNGSFFVRSEHMCRIGKARMEAYRHLCGNGGEMP